MKSICRKSGISLAVCDDGLPQTVCDLHPIFRLDKPALYKLMQKTPARLPIQRRLYFLSLLSLTDLVTDWSSPYIPSDETVELAFPLLLEVHSLLGERKAELPTVRLGPDCAILDIIKLWRRGLHGFGTVARATETDQMLAINEVWHKAAQNKLQPRHIAFAVEKLASLGYSDAQLAAASNVLSLQAKAVSAQRHRYLTELYESLQDCLPVSDQWRNVSFYVLRHVQNMIDHCVLVKAELLGNKVRKEEQQIAGVTSFQFVAVDEKEADRIESAIENAEKPEPKQADFSDFGAFIKARAAWRAAKFARLANK